MNTNNIFLSLLLLVSLSFFASCAADTAAESTTAADTDDKAPSAITVETSTPTIKVDSAQIKKLVEEKEAELAAVAEKEAEEKAEKEKLASIEAEKKAKEKKRLAELKRKKAEADKKAAEAAAANNTIAVTELPVSKPVIKPAPKPKKTGAKIKFDTKTHSFGTIKEGDVVKHEFYYTNVGTEELVIKDASATCGCTAPGFSFFPLAPGLSSAISVTFNSKNKAGAQRPEVTIITNGYPSKHVLTMEGVVEK